MDCGKIKVDLFLIQQTCVNILFPYICNICQSYSLSGPFIKSISVLNTEEDEDRP